MYYPSKELKFHELIGKEVYAVRGVKDGNKKKYIPPKFILFNDGETVIQIEDQDYYTYHDCAASAKHFTIWQSKQLWDIVDQNTTQYPKANDDL